MMTGRMLSGYIVGSSLASMIRKYVLCGRGAITIKPMWSEMFGN